MEARRGARPELWIAIASAGVALVAYGLTLCRTVYFGDSAELSARWKGATLLRAYSRPRGRWLARGHAFAGDWLRVVGRPMRSLPKRSARAIVGAMLRDCIVLARTSVVARRMDRERRAWVATEESEHYSIATELIGVAAGSPPARRSR